MFHLGGWKEILMLVIDGLILIAEVIVIALLLVGFYHEDRFVALEKRIFRAVRARHVRRKRSKAQAYLEKKGPAKAQRAAEYLEKTDPKANRRSASRKASERKAQTEGESLTLDESYRELLAASRLNVPEVTGVSTVRRPRLRLVSGGRSDHDAA